MALYLKIERPEGPRMVRRGSGVRVPASASPQIRFSKRFLDGCGLSRQSGG
jgi:hypothetical protein